MADERRFPTFVDARGSLTAVDFDDVPFPVCRVFVVHGAEGGPPRGGHLVPCHELVVLISGTASFRVSSDAGGERTTRLGERGARILLRPGECVSYELDGPASSILVLAAEPFRSREER